MLNHAFRFGLVVGQIVSAQEWGELAKKVEDLGYSTLLMPDVTGIPASFPSLAVAAATTSQLRVGNFVLDVPLRPAGAIAWEAATLDRLSDGRFELGLGAGRPGGEQDAGVLERPFGSPGERVQQLSDAIDTVHQYFADAIAAESNPQHSGATGSFLPTQRPHPPIMVAGGGERLLRVAGRKADIVAFGLSAGGTEQQLREKIDIVRAAAADRFDSLELSTNVWAFGDMKLPGRMSAQVNFDTTAAQDNRYVAALYGDLDSMTNALLRRRDELGISYITVHESAMEKAAPLIERLAGR